MRLEVSVPVIAMSIMELFRSRDRSGWAARAIALLRNGFGGHPLGSDPVLARHRRQSRLADLAEVISGRTRPPGAPPP